MRFLDRTLLRLTDSTERAALFSLRVADDLLAAAYTPDEVSIETPSAIVIREVTLTPLVHAHQALAASGREVSSSTQWQVVAELPPKHVVAGHAVIEADITASTRGVNSEIVEVTSSDLAELADLEILDARIEGADGALPEDPAALASRRYDELVASIIERVTDVPAVAVVDALADRGLVDLATLVDFLSPPHTSSRLALTIVTDSTAPPTDRLYRLTSLVSVAERLGDELATALHGAALARAALAAGSDPQAKPAGMSPRAEYPLIIFFPADDLDDDDLPFPAGQAPVDPEQRRAARLQELSTRLRSVAAVPVAI